MMKTVRAKRAWCLAVLVSGLFLAWASPPAFGLSIVPHGGCGELCDSEFWAGAGAKEVAAALAGKPAALAYRRTMLRLAVKSENAAATAALLRAGAPPNGQEQPGRYDYMLHEAARRALVSVLLKAGAFPGVANEEGWTPLQQAARWGRPVAVALLLEAGADPRAPGPHGLTAVELARRRGDHENPNLWHERHTPPLPPPCRDCWDDLLALLLAPPPAPPPCGRLCEAPFWRTATGDQVRSALAKAPAETRWSAPGGAPLHLALAAGVDVETVKLLLDHGMDPNGRDIRDDTPLHVAARTPGGAGSVRLLLGRGAMLDALNARDWTPLHAASERASTLDAMRVLRDAGGDPDIRAGETFGVTPRHLAMSQPEGPKAAMLILGYRGRGKASPRKPLSSLLRAAAGSGHSDTVKFLLSLGADAHDPDIFGNTALRAASSSGNIKAMLVLLWHGAKPGYSKYDGPAILSGEGERPLHMAVPHPAALKLLLESGADPDGRTLTGETPLHLAARTCVGKSLALLLAHGADPNVRGRYGQTPLHEAVRRVADSRDSSRIRRRWLASCEREERENKPGWEECRTRVSEDFKERYEARKECATSIATLLQVRRPPRHRQYEDWDLGRRHAPRDGETA